MVKTNKNIIDFKKAILIALASICLSFLFAGNTSAQDFHANTTQSYENKEIHTSTYYSQKSIIAAATEKKNAVCDLKKMRERYQSSCYSCMVVKTLTEAFMKGCSKAYPIARDAGSKIAIIGAIIWMVLFAMKNVSSFTSLEPSNNINDILVFLFKVLVAIVFINAGIGVLVEYIVEPILIAGADYGMGIITSNTGFTAPSPEYNYDGVEIISTKSINKLFGLNQAIDKVVSENLIIGNALICHSMNAGAWVDASLWIVTLKIPSLWIMFCGAAIWVAGFMLTLSISYYVLDVSFKLGFAIILLPVAIGLWPFEATKKKLSDVLSIIFKSTAIFAFLAITTSYSLGLIGAAMGGVDELYGRIENDDATWISQKFDITGSFFILIIFAYLYSLKMIGGTINNYVNKFFKDSIFGKSSPIHDKTTQATDIAKQKSVGLAKGAAALGGKAAVFGGKKAVAGARGLIRNAIGDEKGGTTLVGNARKAGGRFAQFAGRKAEKLGDMNRKLSQDLKNFSDKQVAKGVGKKNIFNLAVGGLAGKMAIANANIPGVAKANGISKSLGASLQKWGAKEEQKGKDFNASYRGIKTQAKNLAKEEIDLAKSAANQGKLYVKGVIKDSGDSIKDDARRVGNAVKGTKVYKAAEAGVRKVGDVADKTGTALSNGYIAAATTTKGAIVGAARKTTQTANQIGNKAVNVGKRTAVYKAGRYAVNKSVQGATYVGGKTVQGAQFVKGATVDTVQRTKEMVVESSAYKVGEKTVQGIQTADRSIRDAAISVRSTIGGGVGATGEFVQGINTSIKNKIGGAISSVNDARKQAGTAINGAVYKGLGGEKLAEKFTGVKEAVANNEAPKEFSKDQEKQKESSKENKYSREEAIRKELEKIEIDYSSMKKKEEERLEYSRTQSRLAIEEAKKYDSLAKEASTEEERVKLKALADEYRIDAKKTALVADMEKIKLNLIHEKENKRVMDSKLYAKVVAGNAFRDSLSEKDKKNYDKTYESTHKAMNQEWDENAIRHNTEEHIKSIKMAEKFGVSEAVIEGEGYSYRTDKLGHVHMTETNGYNYISPDALNEADRKLYDSIVEKKGDDANEQSINREFAEAKQNEILDKMHQEHMKELDKARGISDSEREDLDSDKIRKEAELDYENAARRANDIERKEMLEATERNAIKEIEKEAERQREVELDKIKERVLKQEEEMRAEAEKAKEREQEAEKNQEADKSSEKEQKEREEKDIAAKSEDEKRKEEEKKKDAEREDKRKKDKEEQLKSEKEKKVDDEKRQAEEEKRKKEDEDRKNQESRSRIDFENEYSDLIKKYNITDASSVESLSAEQRQSLKDGIERLKSKYKQ